MTHLSLCSGIGGLDLAAEWAGFKTVAQCEIDDFASRILAKNFKGVPNLHDIRTVTAARIRELIPPPSEITVLSAGFPCQPYSLAGKGLGDRDVRDLWGEVARVLGELKPRWFVGENTPGLFSRENQRHFRRILSDLTQMGYRVGWGIWGACDVGAPHKRNRVFILAYSNGKRRRVQLPGSREIIRTVVTPKTETLVRTGSVYGNVHDPDSNGRSANTAPQYGTRQTLEQSRRENESCRADRLSNTLSDADSTRKLQQTGIEQESGKRTCDGSWWQTEPDVGRLAHGVPALVEQIRGYGNAVVPFQALPIFEAIAEFEQNR